MIKLTRLSGDVFLVNADLIRYVESLGDTFVTLTTGDRIAVQESMDEVLERAVEYQQLKAMVPKPRNSPSPSAPLTETPATGQSNEQDGNRDDTQES